jgi:membrane protein required for colicin V production
MNWLDIVILVGAGILGFIGFRFGLLKIAALFVGICVGIVIGSRFSDEVARVLLRWIDDPAVARIAAYAVILGVSLLAAVILAAVLRKVLEAVALGWLDKVGGLAVGILGAFVIFSAILSYSQELGIAGMMGTRVIEDSVLGSFLADKFDVVLRVTRLIPKGLRLE